MARDRAGITDEGAPVAKHRDRGKCGEEVHMDIDLPGMSAQLKNQEPHDQREAGRDGDLRAVACLRPHPIQGCDRSKGSDGDGAGPRTCRQTGRNEGR